MRDWYRVEVSINGDDPVNWWEGPLKSCLEQKAIQENLRIPGQKRTAKIVHVEEN